MTLIAKEIGDAIYKKDKDFRDKQLSDAVEFLWDNGVSKL